MASGSNVTSAALPFEVSDSYDSATPAKAKVVRVVSGTDWAVGQFTGNWGGSNTLSLQNGLIPFVAGAGPAAGHVFTIDLFLLWHGNSNTEADTAGASRYSNVAFSDSRFDKDIWYSFNHGINGRVIEDMVTDVGDGTFDNVEASPATLKIVCAQEFLNSISFGTSTDLAACQTNFINYCDAVHARGSEWRVIFSTILGPQGDPTKQALSDSMTAWLLAHGEEHADKIVDLTVYPETVDFANATYWDSIHFTAALHEIIAPAWANAALIVAGLGGTVTSVSVDQGDITLYGGAEEDFTATLVGDPVDPTIGWTIQSGPGSINASTGAYTAPGGLASGSQSAVIRAASHQDPMKYDEATVTIPIHQAGGGSSRKPYGGHYQPR